MSFSKVGKCCTSTPSKTYPLRVPELLADLGLSPWSWGNRTPINVPRSVDLMPMRTREIELRWPSTKPSTTSKLGNVNENRTHLKVPGWRGPASKPGNETKIRRSLFVVERHAVTPQRDTQWIQDTTERIEAYLKQLGIRQTLFHGSLRQMSTKQFVAVVNHFLRCAGCTQIALDKGNHIESLLVALRQLRYPHKVNRSWLLTPTVTHCFGYVLMMLDFLMDFAPPPEADSQAEFAFTEDTLDEFIFGKAVKLFPIYQANKSKLCDILDQDSELAEMKSKSLELKQLKAEESGLDADIMSRSKELQQLREKLKTLQTELLQCKYLLQAGSVKCKGSEHLLKTKDNILQSTCSEPEYQKQEVAQPTTCSLEKLYQLKDELQMCRRVRQELCERDHLQKLQLRRARKELLTSIEAFNVRMRDLIYSSRWRVSSSLQLELPIHPTREDVAQRHKLLQLLRSKMDIESSAVKTKIGTDLSKANHAA
ncbi:kinetochore and Eb1-associated basic protein [Scaptodrosophila lebanonensis]|uniref:Kinetochore protein NDC80 n=1 Tax=Drosophila lebanonensis TaxID=7225 RepID=A0A6J2U6H2_DROLE|nr:kinetochore and Eb1-associated basic protein [Scaptodrosophila lebanonensis]